jgi:hypothetical protein
MTLFKNTNALVEPQSHLPAAFQVRRVLLQVHSDELFLALVKVPLVPHLRHEPSAKVTSVVAHPEARLRVVDDTIIVSKRKVRIKHPLTI